MSEEFKKSNTYNFLFDLIWDITEDYRTNLGKEYNINETIEKIVKDDNFWQKLNDYIWNNLVENTEIIKGNKGECKERIIELYLKDDLCMGEILANVKCEDLTNEENFELYTELMEEFEGDKYEKKECN